MDKTPEHLRYEINALQHVLNDKYRLFDEAKAAGESTTVLSTDIDILRTKIRARQDRLSQGASQ